MYWPENMYWPWTLHVPTREHVLALVSMRTENMYWPCTHSLWDQRTCIGLVLYMYLRTNGWLRGRLLGLDKCPGWCESSLGTHHLVGVNMHWLRCLTMINIKIYNMASMGSLKRYWRPTWEKELITAVYYPIFKWIINFESTSSYWQAKYM